MTDKAKSPKSAPMLADADGALHAGQGLLGQRQRLDEGLQQGRGEEARRVDEVVTGCAAKT